MKSIFTLLILFVVFNSLAKDITIKVKNGNRASLVLYAGTISPKDNIYNDNETVFMREQLQIKKTGRPIRPLKKGQTTLRDLSNGDILIVFGLYEGGGRTEVWRYRVKDIERVLSLTIEKIHLYRPAKYYIHIVRDLIKTGNAGAAVEVGNESLSGVFVYYNVTKAEPDTVFVLNPKTEVAVTEGEKSDNSFEGFVRFDAGLPYMCDSQLYKVFPEDQIIPCQLVEFAGYKELSKTFQSGFKFLSWNINGSQHIEMNSSDIDFMSVLNSTDPVMRKQILSHYARDIHRYSNSKYHLFMISSMQKTDLYSIVDHKFRSIQDTTYLLDGDLLTGKGNKRLNGTTDTIFRKTNFIGHIQAIDITPLLYYLVARYEPFMPEPFDAGNCLQLYEVLGTVIELPACNEDALSLTDPKYTIEQVKKQLNDPEVEKKLNEVLKESITGPIPYIVIDKADELLKNGKH